MPQYRVATVAALLALASSYVLAQNETTPAQPAPTEAPPESRPVSQETYSSEEILKEASEFFGATTEGLAKVIEKAFAEQGRPNAYIVGREGSGALGVGLRYGDGQLRYKGGGALQVFWQGPSVGWDVGGNASKVFTLVYNLRSTSQLLQRYPGVDGSLYFVAGVGMNYQRSGEVTLAPIRTGVGLRAGASIGYLHYTLKKSWIPL